MNEVAWTLDNLVADDRIAPDWVPALRTADPAIDAKVAACLEKVTQLERYLPVESEVNSVMWRAYRVPLREVRVLVLGQDPYPDCRRATGLSFSTGPGGDIPASLANIYAELGSVNTPTSGNLEPWASRGVMLLNRALTLPQGNETRPRSHVRWWSPLARATMRAIGAEAAHRPIAAMLWGVHAHGMEKFLGPHVEVFKSSHPSPMSVDRAANGSVPFRGSNPFNRVDDWFVGQRVDKVDWALES